MEKKSTVTKNGLKHLARSIAAILREPRKSRRARIVTLSGNLGGGKTAFTQALAATLGVRERVLSPTFVFMREHKVPAGLPFKKLIHIDAYRIETKRDFLGAGLGAYFKDSDNLVVVEWGEKIKRWIPRADVELKFRHHSPRRRVILVERNESC